MYGKVCLTKCLLISNSEETILLRSNKYNDLIKLPDDSLVFSDIGVIIDPDIR